MVSIILVHDDGRRQRFNPGKFLADDKPIVDTSSSEQSQASEPEETRVEVEQVEPAHEASPETSSGETVETKPEAHTSNSIGEFTSEMNHKPDVHLRWDLGATEKGIPIHVAVFGTGLFTIASYRSETRLSFIHFKSDDNKIFECPPCKSVGRAKVEATKIAQSMIDQFADSIPHKTNAEKMEESFIHWVPTIQIGETNFRVKPNRSRREVDAAVLVYKNRNDLVEVRLWPTPSKVPGGMRTHIVFAHVEDHRTVGWLEATKQKGGYAEFATINPTLPPFQRLDWQANPKTGVLTVRYGKHTFEIVVGDGTSQLQVRRRGKTTALRCAPTEDLKQHALVYLHDYELEKSKQRTAERKSAESSDKPREPRKQADKDKPAKTSEKPAQRKRAAEPKPEEVSEPPKDKPSSREEAKSPQEDGPKKPAKEKTKAKTSKAKKTQAKKTQAKKTASKDEAEPADAPTPEPEPEPESQADALADDKPIDDAKRQLLLSHLDEEMHSGDSVPSLGE